MTDFAEIGRCLNGSFLSFARENGLKKTSAAEDEDGRCFLEAVKEAVDCGRTSFRRRTDGFSGQASKSSQIESLFSYMEQEFGAGRQ